MPAIEIDGVRHFYRLEGRDDLPVLVLSHSLGLDHGQWDPQMPSLLEHVRVLRYDIRGHGATDAPAGDYSIEGLGRDVIGLIDALGIERFAYCGLSLGGMIGQWLAAHFPDRVTRLVLANTSARIDGAAIETRRQTVLAGGIAAIAEQIMLRFFTPDVVAHANPFVSSAWTTLLSTSPIGYAGCCAAIRDMDNLDLLSRIEADTLIVSGNRDVSTPWSGHGEHLAAAIPHVRTVHLPAAHISNLERPRSFTAAILEFLVPRQDDAFEAGNARRRAVLSDDHVDRALANANEFNRPFQDLITKYVWGDVWSRPGLDVRTRRLIALAILASLGRWDEFRLHTRHGLAREQEPCDLREALLLVAVYAGVPAANAGHHIVREES